MACNEVQIGTVFAFRATYFFRSLGSATIFFAARYFQWTKIDKKFDLDLGEPLPSKVSIF